MTRARDLADSADKDIAGTLTLDGLTVDGGTAYHKLISTFPATYTTNLQVGQQVNISNNAVTDTLSIENTGTAAATNIQFSTAGSERMRIDSSGNVGIGTSSPSETLDVSGNIRALGANSRVMFGPDGFEAGIKYATDASLQIASRTGESITFTNGHDGAERMRIDGSGNLLVGTTSSLVWNGAASKKYTFGGGSNNTIVSMHSDTTTAGQGVVLEGLSTSTTSFSKALGSIAFVRENASTTSLRSFTALYTNYDGTPYERMRITSSGGVAIGDTNPTRHGQTTKTLIYNGSGTTGDFALHVGRVGTGTENQVCFSNGYGKVGSITTSGTSTAYNTSSDYRLKENVTDVTDGITRLKQLAPKRFNFIANPDTTVDGFIAHEAQAVVPEAVTGTHNEVDDEGNAVMQGIDQSKLVPLLTAALQEAIAKIETLETKVAALEGA